MEAGAPSRGKTRRWVRTVAVAAACAIVLAAAGAAMRRRILAEYAILWWLERLELDRASLVVTRFDTEVLELADVHVGPTDSLSIQTVETRYSLTRLLGGRLDALRVAGLRVRGTVDASGLSLGALQCVCRGETAHGVGPPCRWSTVPLSWPWKSSQKWP